MSETWSTSPGGFHTAAPADILSPEVSTEAYTSPSSKALPGDGDVVALDRDAVGPSLSWGENESQV